jgi:hypothetical protein
MSVTALIVLVVIVVLVLGLIAWALAMTRRQKRAQAAGTLRTEASRQAVDVAGARTRAEIAEREAEEARRALAQTEAAHEDTLRDADRLDPRRGRAT